MSEFLKFDDLRHLLDKLQILENEQAALHYSFNKLLNNFANLEREIKANYRDFIEYSEKNPKPNEQWVEPRLRALEDKVARLEMGKDLKHE
jgi:hypothetical protein